MLTGSMVAVVTPMDADGAINYRDLARVLDFHVAAGTEALIVAGTTGESATLNHVEHIELIERACELADGCRVPWTNCRSTLFSSSLRITTSRPRTACGRTSPRSPTPWSTP